MELMGQWNYFVYEGFTDGSDEALTALHDDLDWFPMPATASGEGDPTASMGGGDGFSCYKDAPAECAGFLSYLVSDDVQRGYVEAVGGLPVAPAATDAITDPVLQEIAQTSSNAGYVQAVARHAPRHQRGWSTQRRHRRTVRRDRRRAEHRRPHDGRGRHAVTPPRPTDPRKRDLRDRTGDLGHGDRPRRRRSSAGGGRRPRTARQRPPPSSARAHVGRASRSSSAPRSHSS
ncbi:hypothetical protein [Demequina litorisediminis]|nr:hypothetical protein [Demequina litorisediminis]